MKQLRNIMAAVLLLVVVAAPGVIAAQDLSASDRREAARQRALDRAEAKDARIAEIKEDVAARKLEIAQAACERRQQKLQESIPRISRNATSLKEVIGRFYERVQGFYESSQLTVVNYDVLVEAVELAKANAEASLEVVAAYEVEVDCESEDVGSQLDGFRTAVAEARTSLKDYRKALVDLISSMRSAAAEGESDGEDTNSSETENETEQETENETETEGGETQE